MTHGNVVPMLELGSGFDFDLTGRHGRLMKSYSSSHAHNKHGDERNGQVHYRGHNPGKGIDILWHIDLGNQSSIANDRSKGHTAGFRKKVEHHRADDEVAFLLRGRIISGQGSTTGNLPPGLALCWPWPFSMYTAVGPQGSYRPSSGSSAVRTVIPPSGIAAAS